MSLCRYSRIGANAVLIIITFVAAAHASDVDTAWTRFYNGPANLGDYAFDVAVDPLNNVYVTGYSPATGHTFNDYDVFTIKYGPNGDTLWESRINGAGDTNEHGRLIEIGKDTLPVIVAYHNITSQIQEIFVIKLDQNGDTLWTRTYLGSGNTAAYAYNMIIDNTGDITIAGYVFNGNDNDILVLRYDTNGNLEWAYQNDAGGDDDRAFDLVADLFGNIYIAASFYNAGDADWAVIKRNQDGTDGWFKTYDGPAGLNDGANSIEFDISGYLYVCGNVEMGSGNLDIAVRKYNLSGDSIWTSFFDGPVDNNNVPYGSVINVFGDVTVVAKMFTTASIWYMTLINFDPAGDTNWVRYLKRDITIYDFKIDPAGAYYIAGSGLPPSDIIWTDWLTYKVEPNGDSAWAKWLYNGISSATFQNPSALAIDWSNNVIVAGAVGSAGSRDYCTRKYSQSCCDTPGDANNDGSSNVGDAVYILNFVFNGGPAPICMAEGDANNDCGVNVGDGVYLINFVFKGGPAPVCGCAQ